MWCSSIISYYNVLFLSVTIILFIKQGLYWYMELNGMKSLFYKFLKKYDMQSFYFI